MPESPLLDHCPEGLPAAAYRDPDWFAREARLIWARTWVHALRESDLSPGTIRRLTIAGDPLILLRDASGEIRAFHNTCRHRGAELCAADQAFNGKLIRCPYHDWAYDCTGRLVSTGFATPTADFERADHGLYPVHLRRWNGGIYLCLAAEPPAFAPDPGPAALDHWPMAALVTGHVETREIACNWKVFWENYNECLHCPGIHPGLSALVPVYRKGVMSPAESPGFDGPALRDGATSWTRDGLACGPVFAGLDAAERAEGHRFVTLYPSSYIVAHADYVRVVTLTPLAPDRTALRAEWLFLPATLAQPGFDLAHVTDFAAGVLAEDAAACEMNQRGLASSRFTAARLMPQEFEIAAFHGWVRRMLAAG